MNRLLILNNTPMCRFAGLVFLNFQPQYSVICTMAFQLVFTPLSEDILFSPIISLRSSDCSTQQQMAKSGTILHGNADGYRKMVRQLTLAYSCKLVVPGTCCFTML